MNTIFTLSIILFAASFMFVLWARMKEIRANIRLHSAEIMKEAVEESMRHYDALLGELPRTCYNPERFDIEDNGHNIAVLGYYPTDEGGDYPVAIKFFRYDDGDKEYALLEAGELLELLNEKS